jgi:hypothetical protein
VLCGRSVKTGHRVYVPAFVTNRQYSELFWLYLYTEVNTTKDQEKVSLNYVCTSG